MHQPDLVLAPIQLLDYDIAEQALQVHPGADYDRPPGGVALGMGVSFNEADDRTVSLTLGMGINEKVDDEDANPNNAYYRGRFAVRGEFSWVGGDEIESEERRRLMAVNGLAALYGIARVYVRQLSEPIFGPPLVLPMLSFASTVEPLLRTSNGGAEAPE